MKDGSRFFGVMKLASELVPGVSLAVGIRNSVGKSFPLDFCAGQRVFCCGNLAFRSELIVKKRHTIYGERNFLSAIGGAGGTVSRVRGDRDPAYRAGEKHPAHPRPG